MGNVSELVRQIIRDGERDVKRHLEYANAAKRATHVAVRIFMEFPSDLVDDIVSVTVDGIGEEITVCTTNHRVVHALAKIAGIEFKKRFKEYNGTFEYTGKFGTTEIKVYGVKFYGKCKLERVEKTEKVVKYRLRCE